MLPAAPVAPWLESDTFGGVGLVCPRLLVRAQDTALDEDHATVKVVLGGKVMFCWPFTVIATVGEAWMRSVSPLLVPFAFLT